jgi:hypothetical protein
MGRAGLRGDAQSRPVAAHARRRRQAGRGQRRQSLTNNMSLRMIECRISSTVRVSSAGGAAGARGSFPVRPCPEAAPRGGEAPAGAGAERRTPWPALRSGRSLHREGPPVHDADRRAFRRFTAAILGFGTVLPGPDGGHFARPDPGGFGLRSSGPRPARQGAVPRSWDGRWTRSLPGICLRGTSAGAAPRSAFRTPPEGALGEWGWRGI